MKKNILLDIICIIILSLNLQAQDCDKLIQNGLYSFTKMTNTGSFSKDLRTYFLSDQFREDMRHGKWGGSITVPIEGIPITLGANDDDTKYEQFNSI